MKVQEVTKLKVSATSQTKDVARAIYAVLMKEGVVAIDAIGEPSVARATKAVASINQMFAAEEKELVNKVGWVELEVEGRGKLSAIRFELAHKA